MKRKLIRRVILPLMLLTVGLNAISNPVAFSEIVYGTSAEQGAYDSGFEVYMANCTDQELMDLVRANCFSTGKIKEMLNRGRCLGYYETLKAEGWIPQDFVPTSMQSSSSSSTSNQTATSTSTTTEPEKTYTEAEIEAAWKETSRTEPTCTEVGVIKYKNTITGKTKSEEIPVIDHTYEVLEQIPATCTEEGKITYICTMCEDSYEEVIVKTEHDYQQTIQKEATCTEDGEALYVCAICGDSYTEVVSATGHTEGEWVVAKEADAFIEGERTLSCKICGEVLETETIPQTSAIPLPVVLGIGVVAVIGIGVGAVIFLRKKASH